jgi:formylglycine-generating enzyme required for sulfatase activity
MLQGLKSFFRNKLLLLIITGFLLGIVATLCSNKAIKATSTDSFCEVCHVHPHVFNSWKLSSHYVTTSGVKVGCVECHLPPEGEGYLKEKIRLGAKDIWGYLTKDSAEFNWEGRRTVEMARHFTYQESCVKCHVNLFPLTLTKEGQDAHLYYSRNEKDLLCLNCHIDVGHYDPNRKHTRNVEFGSGTSANQEVFTAPAIVTGHETFTETIPQTTVSFKMVAIPGGSFEMGSPESEQMRSSDEGPVKKVNITPFFMAETEITWDEFLAFYASTAGEGRSTDTEGARTLADADVDAISGPTPPYGQPDQNWGMGSRPAITMSYKAAEVYCQWLSQVTGKRYRLPTEAEWEYAARGGTSTPYFFEGNPRDFSEKGVFGKFFGKKNENIGKYIIYKTNSLNKTQTPDQVEANPFGLKNMLGNAAEYCADWYAADAYTAISDGSTDPKGPATGEEKVVRGGAFKSDPGRVRSAARDYTRTEAWLVTDPQIPKSMWWLSDCNHVSFRVVCDFDEKTGK